MQNSVIFNKGKMTILALSVTLGLSACANNQAKIEQNSGLLTVSAAEAAQMSESQKLQLVTETYFTDSLKFSPVYATFVGVNDYNDQFERPINAKTLAEGLAFEKKYLAAIEKIDASQLTGQDLLSYEIFKRDREMGIKGTQFNAHLIPISQMGGVHSFFAILGSGSSAQPFNTEKDYRNFISRANGFKEYMDSVVVVMQEGINKGMVHPKPIAEKLVPQLGAHVVDDVTQSVFYAPLNSLDDNTNIDPAAKEALKKDYITMIETVIIPSYKKVYEFVKNEYVPNARSTVGLSDLPNGKSWYEYQIETNTTLPLTAEEIHQYGKSEVARILGEMRSVKETVGFEGDLPAFFEHLRTDDKFYFDSAEELIAGYTEVKDRINAKLPMLFEVFPKADYVVKAVEPFRAASAAGASYMAPAPDGSRPGIFYINTRDLKAQPKFGLETLSIHEAAPGHHFQIAIQQEVESLPSFRKFGGYTVFAEGWALYAESLGKELGLFTDPYMWYGRLSDEQLRAMRLVVDTGLHAFGWSREQAISYMMENSSMAESDIVAEVERYISMPGQALAYKTGQRHIRMLRNKATKALGDKFDVRKFHTQILIDGAVPMPILEAKIDRWIAVQKAS
ncbi:DUF885 domain-containing protein [Aliiglaciecola sp. LCG003]|uniref:DUF885 domain-containing protein n=1 Tax=Aliiglaciecola sp. LCG003 TaxID=3053655 RepID=UPI002572CFCC|nr:DUF885 domain-containing protein [Aliiglaciecola sp. LCG003]WJG07837.1 DUF885 domain-containing protein [Aliiglaciecola sp. LCG003]